MIEHVDHAVGAVKNIRDVLDPKGQAIVLVPHGPSVFGTFD